MPLPLKRIIKDPSETIDYTADYGLWLEQTATGDSIVSVQWRVPPGLTQTNQDFTPTTGIIWVSGGTVGETYQISCLATTANGRTVPFSFDVVMQTK